MRHIDETPPSQDVIPTCERSALATGLRNKALHVLDSRINNRGIVRGTVDNIKIGVYKEIDSLDITLGAAGTTCHYTLKDGEIHSKDDSSLSFVPAHWAEYDNEEGLYV